MAIVFERIETPGIAQLSYLIGDDQAGTAAVIDPRPDVQIYIDSARRHGVAITHVFETHIHADFVSGARDLVHRLGGALLCASGEGGADYGFALSEVRDGDCFEFGSVILTARHTPGHTPEHVSYAISERQKQSQPWGIFSGDSLFVGSAGRPDLLGDDQTESLTRSLFTTLNEFYLQQDDSVIVYPCHGAGSSCGADIGDRPMSTIGYERSNNPFLQFDEFEEFKDFVTEAPPAPSHYRRLKKLNATDRDPIANVPPLLALPPIAFKAAIDAGNAQLLDTRQMLSFGGGHIPCAMSISARPELSVWAGEMLDATKPILLIAEDEAKLDQIIWLLVNTGFSNFAGYLTGGMKSWENAGFELQVLPQMSVHDLNQHTSDVVTLDVRRSDEWKQGHIPGSRHHDVAEMRSGIADLADISKDAPIAVYCGSGYRASIAASILQAHGYRDVRNVPGSWTAWKQSNYAIENPSKADSCC